MWAGKTLKNTCYILSGEEIVMSVEKAIGLLAYAGVRFTPKIAKNVTTWISHTLETFIKFPLCVIHVLLLQDSMTAQTRTKSCHATFYL